MAVTKDKSAPYAPPSAILDIIDRYRNRGMPKPINTEVLARAGVSESLIPRTLQALQVLDLINEGGEPTDVFETIRLAPEAEFKACLQDWLRSTYSDIFDFVDPTQDDETNIRDAFRSYVPQGQQQRMVTLFTGLCAAAGLVSEKAPQPRSRPPRPRTASTPARRAPTPKPPRSSMPNIPAALAGLLNSLPSEGQGWTKEERDKFHETFGHVLDFCFPIIPKNMEEDEP